MPGESNLDGVAMMYIHKQHRPLRQHLGLTLIELLVAIALGGILLTGAISLFINNRATYELTTDMSRLQENARFAMQTMVADLRMAGHIGCGNDLARVNNDTGFTAGELADPTNGLEGFEAGAAGWSPSGYTGGATSPVAGFLANADAFTVRYLVGDRRDTDANGTLDMQAVNSVYSGNLGINVDNQVAAIQLGEVAGISDCGGADVFTVSAAAGNSVTANALSRAYDPINNALVGRFSAARYFVRNNAEGIPSLFRVSFAAASSAELPLDSQEELVDGVRSMQILYGVDTDSNGIPDQYLTAGAAGLTTRNDWLSVISVRIALLMETVDAISKLPDTNTYRVGDVTFCVAGCDVNLPADNRRRRVFQTTVSIRNS